MKPACVRKEVAIAKARMTARKINLNGPPVLAEEMAKAMNINFDYHVGALDYSIVFESEGQYFISVYVTGNSGRDNWSGIHEIAHIDLCHFRYDVDTTNRTVLTTKQRRILDLEADLYTREILMPRKWMFEAVEMPLTACQIGELKDLFMVSWRAIIIRLEELGIAKRDEVTKLFKKVRGSVT